MMLPLFCYGRRAPIAKSRHRGCAPFQGAQRDPKKKNRYIYCGRCRIAPPPVLCAPLPRVLGSSSLLLLRSLLFSCPLRSLLPLALIPAAPALGLRLALRFGSALRLRTTPSH